MALAIVAEVAPLESNEDGVILVGRTRVTLDTVVAVFNRGATAEEIVYRYPSLNLADVYATIAFYLKHQPEVEAYLQQRRQQSQEIRVLANPLFSNSSIDDYHLRSGSPAIGRALAVDPAGATDADGIPRIRGKRGDLGALLYRPQP
jgi:uncharacterized protein (DUF433 family)